MLKTSMSAQYPCRKFLAKLAGEEMNDHISPFHKALSIRSSNVCNALHSSKNPNETYCHLELRYASRFSHTDDKGGGQGSTAQPTFLTATVDDRFEANTRSSPDIGGTNALRAVQLVSRDAHQVDIHLVYIDGYFANRLCCICVEMDAAMLTEELANFLDRLDDTCLIVHCHDGDN